MWYTLPWTFDEFFHEYLPERWFTEIQVFEFPSQKMMTIKQSSLRTLDASGQTFPLPVCSLPYVTPFDYVQTLHLSYYNGPIPIYLSALRSITLVNSINCLNYCFLFPTTICTIRILLFYTYPNYKLPNWSLVLHSLSTVLPQSSLGVFMYDLPKTLDDRSCPMIAKEAPLFRDFSFCFRYRHSPLDGIELEIVFEDHTKFIKRLCHHILVLCLDKQPCYSIEDDGCGFSMWF